MVLSSCEGVSGSVFDGLGVLVEGSVPQHGVEGVEASAGEGDDCLFVGLSFGTLLVVVSPGWVVVKRCEGAVEQR